MTGTQPALPVLAWLEVRGFRSFGTQPRRLDLDAPLVALHARNSQGKSSLAEAVEFLLTDRSSRRDLFGGAKAEYNDSLRNAHLPQQDQAVWVAAGIRSGDANLLPQPLGAQTTFSCAEPLVPSDKSRAGTP